MWPREPGDCAERLSCGGTTPGARNEGKGRAVDRLFDMKIKWKVERHGGGFLLLRPEEDGELLRSLLAGLSEGPERVLVEFSNLPEDAFAPPASEEEALAFGRLQHALGSLPSVTVALIEGDLSGPAAGLALACRVRVGSQGTSLRFPEVADGLLPAGETLWKLVELCGVSEALGLIVRGRKIGARRALDLNLLDALAPPEGLRELGRIFRPRPRRKAEGLFRSRIGRFLVKRQALKELTRRSSPHAACVAVSLVFDYLGRNSASRIRAAARAVARLAADPERNRLAAVASAKRRFLGGEKRPPRRALVVMGGEGWRWTCLLAHYGTKVRWCSQDGGDALAEGMCWLRRDTERYFPDRLSAVLSCVTVSETVCGFAGRDCIVLGGDRKVPGRLLEIAGQEAVILAHDGRGAEESGTHSFPQVDFPCDPLTSRVCTLSGGGEREAALLRGLGFMILPRPEADRVFTAVRAFEEKWEELIRTGTAPEAIMGSLRAFGFATRELSRRKSVYSYARRPGEDAARALVDAVARSLASGGEDGGDESLIELALVLELGWPVHRVRPFELVVDSAERRG